MEKEVNVLAMVKGEERFVFLYDDQNRVETLRMLGRFAADPQLNFTWYDAALMSKKIRDMAALDAAAAKQVNQGNSHGMPWRRNSRFNLSHEEDII
jgi:hypothetical protein